MSEDTAPSTLIERDQLNSIIEESYAMAAIAAVAILQYKLDEQGALRDLFQRFYTPFCLLTVLTSGMAVMQTKPELLEKIRHWEREKAKSDKNSDVFTKLIEGVDLFEQFAVALQEAGVIRLTPRSA